MRMLTDTPCMLVHTRIQTNYSIMQALYQVIAHTRPSHYDCAISLVFMEWLTAAKKHTYMGSSQFPFSQYKMTIGSWLGMRA